MLYGDRGLAAWILVKAHTDIANKHRMNICQQMQSVC